MSGTATNETRDLIASDKVEGTAVYNGTGDRLGTVYNFMVDKHSGQVAYAVLSFGGFLRMGSSYHPLPKELTTTCRGLRGEPYSGAARGTDLFGFRGSAMG
jgi:hypothetical protein